MKLSKSKRIFILAIFYLTVCWILGHYVFHSGNNDKTNIEQDEGNNNITFEGNANTNDTPWGITAGYFDMEGEGQCILLTPNTSVIFNDCGEKEKIEFEYEIHPWVNKLSDGVGLIVICFDSQEHIILEEELYVKSTSEWETYLLDLSSTDSLIDKVQIMCNNGRNNDDSGDWLILNFNEKK